VIITGAVQPRTRTVIVNALTWVRNETPKILECLNVSHITTGVGLIDRRNPARLGVAVLTAGDSGGEITQQVDYRDMSWTRTKTKKKKKVEPEPEPNSLDLHVHLPGLGTPKVHSASPWCARHESGLLC
jgi:hypothetical protein